MKKFLSILVALILTACMFVVLAEEEAEILPATPAEAQEAAEIEAEAEEIIEEAIEVPSEEIVTEEIAAEATAGEVTENSEIIVEEVTEIPAATASEPAIEAPAAAATEPEAAPVAEATEPKAVPAVEATELEAVPAVDAEIAEDVNEAEAVEVEVRLEGDGMSEIFLTVNKETEFTVVGIEGDWIVIEIDGQIGYIYKDSAEDMEIELPEEETEKPAVVEPKLTIFSSRRSVMQEGEIITLTSKLEGLDGYTITYQWQVNRGNGFENVPGANESTYSFSADSETLSYDWCLVVSFE